MQKTITVKDVLSKCENTFDTYTMFTDDLTGGEVAYVESNGIIFLNKYGDKKIENFSIGNELNNISFYEGSKTNA